MGNYDAEVRISTKVDTSQMQRLQIQIDKATNKAVAFKDKLEELKKQKTSTEAYANLENKLQSAKDELTKLIAEEEKLSSAGMAIGAPWDNVIAKEAEAQLKIESIQEEMQKLVDAGKAFTLGGNKDEIAKAQADLSMAEKELRALLTKQDELGKKSHKVSDGLKRIGEAGRKAFAGMNNHVKRSNGLFSTFRSRLKGILWSLLVFNWVTKGFNAMVSGMKTGFKNLVQYSSDYNRSMSGLMSANTQLKNSFAAAFAPIMQAVIPHLVTLINYITAAMNAVSQFTAVLTGKSTWIRATEVQEDYAASLGGTAAAAKKAAATLASFDTLEVLNKKDKDSDSGAGSGTKPEDMFEEVPIEPSEPANLAKRIKDLIEAEDWYGIGALLGEKLNEALEKINWDSIKASARRIATNIANFLNGGIETVDWRLVGATIAEGLNTALEFLFTFATTFHWDSLGFAIANSINGFFDTFDFELLAETLNKWVDGIKELIKTAFTEIEWKDVTAGLYDFFSNLEIDTITVLLGAIAWKLGGAKLTSALLKEALAGAAGWTITSGALSWTVGIALDVLIASVAFDFLKDPVIELFSGEDKQKAEDLKKHYEGLGAGFKVLGDGATLLKGKLMGLPVAMQEGSFRAGTLSEAMEEIADGVIYTDDQLKKMQKNFGLTNEDIEMLRQEMLMANPELQETADKFGMFDASAETLSDMADGMNALADNTGNASTFIEELCNNMKQPFVDWWNEVSTYDYSVENVFPNLPNAIEWFSGIGNSIKKPFVDWWNEVSTYDYSFDNVFPTASQWGERFGQIVSNVKGWLNGIPAWFEEKKNMVQEWYTTSVAPWFTSEKWYELGQGILEGISLKWQEFCAWWGETALVQWWEEYVAPWFAADTWIELGQGILDGISEKWSELVGWWDSSIVAWWDTYVAPWFTVARWKALGINMMKGIYNGLVGIANKVVNVMNSVISSVEAAINHIIDKINSMIDNLNSTLGAFGFNIGHVGHIEFGRIPTVELPALADGAVIRGGNPFMAILGDQRAGQTNIEAPQSAIEDAVAAGMSKAGVSGGYGNIPEAQLVLDGEVVGRVIFPRILDEWKRGGYDITVLE